MKKIITVVALAVATLATPAMAQTFTGPRVEARVGATHLNVDTAKGRIDADGVTYGVAVGYDKQVLPRVIVGVDLAVDNTSSDKTVRGAFAADSKRDFEASARLGYAVLDNVLVYGRLGYSNEIIGLNFRNTTAGGLRYGGGAEFALSKHLYVKGEYRTTNYDSTTVSHQGLAAVGFRF